MSRVSRLPASTARSRSSRARARASAPAIAEAMAEAGARWCSSAATRQRLARGRRHVRRAPRALALDLTADGAAEQIVEEALDAFGRDRLARPLGRHLLAEARSPRPPSRLDRQWRDQRPRAVRAHAGGVPAPRRGSSVTFVSSIAGHVGLPATRAAYCATKGAIEQLYARSPRSSRRAAFASTRSPRATSGPPMNEELSKSPDYEQSCTRRHADGRVGIVEDIAPLRCSSLPTRPVHPRGVAARGRRLERLTANARRTTSERVRARRGSPT